MKQKEKRSMGNTRNEKRLRKLRQLKKLGRRTVSFRVFFTVVTVVTVFFSVSAALFISELINAYLNRTVGFTTPWFQAGFSFLISFCLMMLLGRVILTPIRHLQAAMDAVSEGDFNASVPNRTHIREIESINQSFDVMVRELKATEILQSDFVSNVSHEFKTPLNAIEGYATLLQDETLTDAERSEYLEKIRFNTQRMSTLVGNILLLSKVDTRAIEGQKTLYSLDEQIRQAIVFLEPKWAEKKIEFDVSFEEVRYYGNEGLMLHVWSNLIGNAIKFSPNGGIIRMSLSHTQEGVLFTVDDSGPGIEENAFKHIYDKFYQSDTSHKEEGNGLGLALVKKILDTAEGQIKAQNLPEGGCRFTVVLPDAQ